MKFKVGDLVDYTLGWRTAQKGIVLEKTPHGTYEVYMIMLRCIIECSLDSITKLSPIHPQGGS